MLMAALGPPQIVQETKYRVLLYRECVRVCVWRVTGRKLASS